MAFSGLMLFIAALGLLLAAQRWLHREVQGLFLLTTHHPELALGLFSLLFLPGVALHEASHFVMARLLGVRTHRFSLIPSVTEDHQLRLGYVETEATDFARDALIGVAPLLSGVGVLAWLALERLGLGALAAPLAAGEWRAALWAVGGAFDQPDFWLWFYLAFAVSAAMLPSASDRRGWLPVGLIVGLLLGAALLAGVGPWLQAHVWPWVDGALGAAGAVLAFSLAVHLVCLLPVWLVNSLLSKVTGYTFR